MVVQPIYLRKHFTVKCHNCKIEEVMIFQSKSLFCNMRSFFTAKIKVPPFYVYVPMIHLDSTGKEIKQIFKPVKGLFGDRLPCECPLCGGKLNIKSIFVKY